MKTKTWFRIEYIKESGNIGCDWRLFEDWDAAENYAKLMYGLNLWNITKRSGEGVRLIVAMV
jgi:hypothetical protein